MKNQYFRQLSDRYVRKADRKRKPKVTAADVAADVEAFLKQGGRIYQCALGETSDADAVKGFREHRRIQENRQVRAYKRAGS